MPATTKHIIIKRKSRNSRLAPANCRNGAWHPCPSFAPPRRSAQGMSVKIHFRSLPTSLQVYRFPSFWSCPYKSCKREHTQQSGPPSCWKHAWSSGLAALQLCKNHPNSLRQRHGHRLAHHVNCSAWMPCVCFCYAIRKPACCIK